MVTCGLDQQLEGEGPGGWDLHWGPEHWPSGVPILTMDWLVCSQAGVLEPVWQELEGLGVSCLICVVGKIRDWVVRRGLEMGLSK